MKGQVKEERRERSRATNPGDQTRQTLSKNIILLGQTKPGRSGEKERKPEWEQKGLGGEVKGCRGNSKNVAGKKKKKGNETGPKSTPPLGSCQWDAGEKKGKGR